MYTRKNKEWLNYIPDSLTNQAIAAWHAKQPPREQVCASPSSILDCPRTVWLKYRKHLEPTNKMGWGKAQRLLLGRNFENQIAKQLDDAGVLLFHWKDDVAGESVKFGMGKGLTRLEGTPDLLLRLDTHIAISDAKTSRADSFGYLPIEAREIWQDYFWYKYKIQVTAYYLLCYANKDWFEQNKLPLPDLCHLFSFALDDGIVRREVAWQPSREDVEAVAFYTKRWNAAYMSEKLPECTCNERDGKGRLFCPYGIMEPGKKVCSSCCSEDLSKNIKE